MEFQLFLFPSSLFFLYLMCGAVAPCCGSKAAAAARATGFIPTKFARASHPAPCGAPLSPSAKSTAKLACESINASLPMAQSVYEFVNGSLTSSNANATNNGTIDALKDCLECFEDAGDLIGESLKQMQQVGTNLTESFSFMMSNVRTWMSAALTDADTCTDGFERVANSPMKTQLSQRVEKFNATTKTALQLVRSCESKGQQCCLVS